MTADQVHDSSDVAFIDILRAVADARETHAVSADLAQRHRPGHNSLSELNAPVQR